MPRHVVLLRGINLGSRNRVPMPALRELLGEAGFVNVRTLLASGNVVLDASEPAEKLARRCERLIAERFGFSVAVITRTAKQLSKVIDTNPLGSVAREPKRYLVTFTTAAPSPDHVRKLEALATPAERLIAIGRELYSWHPEGVARSRLWTAMAGAGLGTTGTARNWNTVIALGDLVADPSER